MAGDTHLIAIAIALGHCKPVVQEYTGNLLWEFKPTSGGTMPITPVVVMDHQGRWSVNVSGLGVIPVDCEQTAVRLAMETDWIAAARRIDEQHKK